MTPRRMITASAIVLLALSTGASAQQPAAPSGPVRPELGIARAIDGNALEVRYFADKEVFSNPPAALPGKIDANLQRGVEATAGVHATHVVETRVMRLELNQIVAKRVDGRAVTNQALTTELAVEKPVLLLTQGQQIDPVFFGIFKPDTLILERPAPAPQRVVSGVPAAGVPAPGAPAAANPAPISAQPKAPAAPVIPQAPSLPKPGKLGR